MVSYRFGPYRLLPDQRQLERDGVTIPMTPKAFDLLVTLVHHRSRALSKDELMTLVWTGAHVEEGNLAQQILLLRRALAEAGDCVATLPRHGYRFVGPVVEEHTKPASANSPHYLLWDGREFPLREGATVIGRGEDADVRISMPSLSRRHARVTVCGVEATLEDLDSRHGSWRGATPVQGVVRLASGDEIRLGTARLVYCVSMQDDTTLD